MASNKEKQLRSNQKDKAAIIRLCKNTKSSNEKKSQKALAKIISFFEKSNYDTQEYVCRTLKKLDDKRAAELLLDELYKYKGERRVRDKIIDLLCYFGGAKVEEKMLINLRSRDVAMKEIAARVLGNIKAASAYEPLRKIAEDENYDKVLRSFAVISLGKLEDCRALDLLIKLLNSEHEILNSSAAEALGYLKDIKAYDPLVTLLKKKSNFSAATALGKLGDKRAAKHLIEADIPIETKMLALGDLGGKEVIEHLKSYLLAGSDYKSSRHIIDRGKLAAEVLRKIDGEEAKEALRLGLGNTYYEVCSKCGEMLGELGDKNAIEPMIIRLWSKNNTCRKSLLNALEKLGESKWKGLLKCTDEDIEILKENSDEEMVDILIRGITDYDDNMHIYSTAKGAIADINNDYVNNKLTELLDADEKTKKRALDVIYASKNANITDHLLERIDKEDDDTKIKIINIFRRMNMNDKTVDAKLLKMLNTESEKVKIEVLNALYDFCDAEMSEQIIKQLKSDNPYIKIGAMQVLGKLKEKEAVEPIINLLKSHNDSVKVNAINALMKISDNRAVKPLIETLSSRDTKISANVVDALVMFKDDSAIEAMADLLLEIYPERKDYRADSLISKLMDALAPYNNSKINNSLLPYVKDYNMKAISILVKNRVGGIYEPLIYVLRKSDDYYMRAAAAKQLGILGDRRAIDPLFTTYKEFATMRAFGSRKDSHIQVCNETEAALKKFGATIQVTQNK